MRSTLGKPLLRSRIAWTIVVGAPVLLGLLETGQLMARAAYEGSAADWLHALKMTMPRWILFIPLTLLIEKLCRRFPLDAPRWRRAAPIHALASVLFALAHLAACVVVYGFLIEGVPNRFSFRLGYLLKIYLAMDLLIYWAAVGGWMALHHARLAREREHSTARLRADLADARMEVLRNQLNPHFLFNTLNAIAVTSMKGEHRLVTRMLESLGELLRVSFDRDLPAEVPLERELRMVDRYLEIQCLRFGDRLTIRREIDARVGAALVPAMLLQPLLENAIQHGIAARGGPGTITIGARREADSLELRIEDDGIGWSGAGPGPEGIGLGNTRSRLLHLYGDKHRIELGASDTGGAVVRVSLPYREDSANAAEADPRAPAEVGS